MSSEEGCVLYCCHISIDRYIYLFHNAASGKGRNPIPKVAQWLYSLSVVTFVLKCCEKGVVANRFTGCTCYW